ncbi:hypothetical protein SHKM778_52160 [Streptomyces sp. KM77-8]|uniref:Glycosyl hydrolase family 36 N-terminal domain-containing protein n=1 Tax=Streptomyces haneummycinicus TaxID=3074435 RepID=A0AAT9HN04_9ACTN
MTHHRWTLRTARTSYTVRLSEDGPWAELDAWGPHGSEDGPSALDRSRRTHFITPADTAPAEYLPSGLRPFTGADLIASRPGGDRGVWWEFDGAEEGEGTLRLAFTDDVLGLRTVLCYATVPGTDVVRRWTEHTCTGGEPLRLERFDSAAVNVPASDGVRLTYLTGQWSQEFQRTQLDLTRGTFTIGSVQGCPATPTRPGSPYRTARRRTTDPRPPTAWRWSGRATGTSPPRPNRAEPYGSAPDAYRTRARCSSRPATPSPPRSWPACSAPTGSTGWPAPSTATSAC